MLRPSTLRTLGSSLALAAAVEERFRKAWANADTTIHATCLCIPAGD